MHQGYLNSEKSHQVAENSSKVGPLNSVNTHNLLVGFLNQTCSVHLDETSS